MSDYVSKIKINNGDTRDIAAKYDGSGNEISQTYATQSWVQGQNYAKLNGDAAVDFQANIMIANEIQAGGFSINTPMAEYQDAPTAIYGSGLILVEDLGDQVLINVDSNGKMCLSNVASIGGASLEGTNVATQKWVQEEDAELSDRISSIETQLEGVEALLQQLNGKTGGSN